jgi:putative oxidoreductase
LGAIFIAHGSQKLFGAFGGRGIEATAEGFAATGLVPGILWAWVVAITEFFGGLGILGGLLMRLSAVGISIIMIVAIATVHGKHGLFAQAGGFEYNLMILGGAISLMLLGPGPYSVQGLIDRLRGKKQVS